MPVTEFLQSCAEFFYSALSNAITSVTGYIFGSDDDSTDSDYAWDWGSDNDLGVATPSPASTPPVHAIETTRLLNPTTQYTNYAALADNEQGKNKTACVFRSKSKRTGEHKLWISKRAVDSRTCAYDINSITTEIFVAWIYVYLFGKDNAPKARFHPDFHGILSRILGDDKDATHDLFTTFLTDDKNEVIPKQAQTSFLKAFIFAIIVGNRDISFENFVFKDPDDLHDEMIYLIDNEYALAPPLQRPSQPFLSAVSTIRKKHMTLYNLLTEIDKDPKNMARIILDIKFDWNNFAMHRTNEISTEDLNALIDRIHKLFFEFFTRDEFISTLQEIVRNIEVRDFDICTRAREKMLQQLAKYPTTYSQELVAGTIVPRIEAATAMLKENVACINAFLAEKGLQAGTPTGQTTNGRRLLAM